MAVLAEAHKRADEQMLRLLDAGTLASKQTMHLLISAFVRFSQPSHRCHEPVKMFALIRCTQIQNQLQVTSGQPEHHRRLWIHLTFVS